MTVAVPVSVSDRRSDGVTVHDGKTVLLVLLSKDLDEELVRELLFRCVAVVVPDVVLDLVVEGTEVPDSDPVGLIVGVRLAVSVVVRLIIICDVLAVTVNERDWVIDFEFVSVSDAAGVWVSDGRAVLETESTTLGVSDFDFVRLGGGILVFVFESLCCCVSVGAVLVGVLDAVVERDSEPDCDGDNENDWEAVAVLDSLSDAVPEGLLE